jgi:hypothetical protein
MEAVYSSETMVPLYVTAGHDIFQADNLRIHRRQDLAYNLFIRFLHQWLGPGNVERSVNSKHLIKKEVEELSRDLTWSITWEFPCVH